MLVQRNIYICALTIFVTLALNAYILLFRSIYRKKDNFELARVNLTEPKDQSKATSVATERAKIE